MQGLPCAFAMGPYLILLESALSAVILYVVYTRHILNALMMDSCSDEDWTWKGTVDSWGSCNVGPMFPHV